MLQHFLYWGFPQSSSTSPPRISLYLRTMSSVAQVNKSTRLSKKVVASLVSAKREREGEGGKERALKAKNA